MLFITVKWERENTPLNNISNTFKIPYKSISLKNEDWDKVCTKARMSYLRKVRRRKEKLRSFSASSLVHWKMMTLIGSKIRSLDSLPFWLLFMKK